MLSELHRSGLLVGPVGGNHSSSTGTGRGTDQVALEKNPTEGRASVPLIAGAAHYWRLDPHDWRRALLAVKEMGCRFVDTYVPWSVHEQSDGSFDFGQRKAALDVGLFLRIAGELGLFAIVRPGPHINAELSTFGIPERVLWDESCQARGPTGAPVVLPFVPRMFPVPSYASDAFHQHVERYFDALAPVLAPLCQPHGPVALLQIDNEGAFYFRDGVYDQDYHPDAIARYRDFLRDSYGTVEALRSAYPAVASADGEELVFANVPPPTTLTTDEQSDLAYHLDWAAFQEHLLAKALARFADALRRAGLPALPTLHNLPMGQEATPLNPALIGGAVDLIALDFYNHARAIDRRLIARRTSELAVRCDGMGHPAFAAEMAAGFPPYFPPLSADDNAFTLLTALAYGLRGFNLYMAVERDRWVGAPIDPRGGVRPAAAFYQKVNAALERVDWFSLRRATPVRIVIPRAERRLARILHAFGPLSGALLGVLGLGPREAAIETQLDLDAVPAVDVDTLLRALEQSLEARGVPFAVVGGEAPEICLAGAEWVIVLTSGGFSEELAHALGAAAAAGTRITLGPCLRRFDERFRPVSGTAISFEHNVLLHSDPRSVDGEVAEALRVLWPITENRSRSRSAGANLHACDPDGVLATVHEDGQGEPRVVFVMNTGDAELLARVTLGHEHSWEDALDGTRSHCHGGVLEIRMRPGSVRMLARADIETPSGVG